MCFIVVDYIQILVEKVLKMRNLIGDNSRETVIKSLEVIRTNNPEMDKADSDTFNYLLKRAYHNLDKSSIHEIPVSDLLKFLNHTSIQRIENSLKKLGSINITIDYTDNDTGAEHSVQTHYLSYDVSKAENGILTYAFDPILLKFLWEPKVYARINIFNIRNFKSVYTGKLYEMAALYQNRFHRSWELTVNDLKEFLGVEHNQHARFDNFKSKVIDKSVQEINEVAPYHLDYELIRGGRGGKVIAVRFEIKARKENLIDITPSQKEVKSLKRDPNTIDMIDGFTDAERSSSLILSPSTFDAARELLISKGRNTELINNYEDSWRNQNDGLRIIDPDTNFLRFIELSIANEDDEFLKDLDNDVFGSLLEEFE